MVAAFSVSMNHSCRATSSVKDLGLVVLKRSSPSCALQQHQQQRVHCSVDYLLSCRQTLVCGLFGGLAVGKSSLIKVGSSW